MFSEPGNIKLPTLSRMPTTQLHSLYFLMSLSLILFFLLFIHLPIQRLL